MAGWKESVGRFAQNAVSKSKEMAEITRLNMEISNQEQRLRELYGQLGQYLVENPDLVPADRQDAQALLRIQGRLLQIAACGSLRSCPHG